MIPAAPTMTHETTMVSKRRAEATIGDPRWVMRSMADLYSDRELACVREYSTNAFDAGKERALLEGIDIPAIEVTLPSLFNDNKFIVRDYGYGMSEDTLAEVYLAFGTSSKRFSNDFNGILGFGSKSAVAYTDQFTVTSIHDGRKVIVTITREPDYTIALDVLYNEPTDEASGTEVTIPIHNAEEFNTKARNFYGYWRPGTVLLNGSEPDHTPGEMIAEGFYRSSNERSYIVMGNVPYRINNPSFLFRKAKMNYVNFVAYADTGEVEFTPSREDLKYTDLTNKALDDIIISFADSIVTKAKDDLENATTHAEAYETWKKWTGLLGKDMFDELEFQGDKFVSDYDLPAGIHHRYYAGTDKYHSAKGTRRISKWGVEVTPRTMFVTEFSVQPSSRAKAMAKTVGQAKGWGFTYILFTTASEAEINCPWIKKEQFLTYEEVKALAPKAPKVSRGPAANAGRVPGSWDYYKSNASLVYESTIPAKGDLYYITPTQRHRYSVRDILNHMKFDEDTCVIVVPGNRLNKFKRENPTVKALVEKALDSVVLDGQSLLSDDAKRAWTIDYGTSRWLNELDLSKIKDPKLAEFRDLTKRKDALTKKYETARSFARVMGKSNMFKVYNNDDSWNYLKDNYVMLPDHPPYFGYGYRGNEMEHQKRYMAEVVEYINALYETRNKKEEE